MRECLAKWFQDYHEGISFRGRILFGVAARVAEVGYRAGYHVNRMAALGRRDPFRPRAAVIGVGSLVVGGSGKTSLVDYLVAHFLQAGRRVAILTRGYGRRSDQRVIIGPGEGDTCDVDLTGDEPFMLARRLPGATVVVDADRAGAARDIERRSAPDVLVLDDAARYGNMAYDCRIFTITAADLAPPFRLLPAGRWRAPATRMREADIVGIFGESSSEQARRQTEVLHRLGFSGPIIHFEYQLESWRDLEGKSVEFPMLLEGGGAGAFCGLARPGSFFSWLVSRGVTPVQTWRFADHHRYQRRDLDSLAAQARQAGLAVLITTEKDAVKLARFTDPGVRIIYPDVRLSPGRGAEEFNRVVESAIGRQIRN